MPKSVRVLAVLALLGLPCLAAAHPQERAPRTVVASRLEAVAPPADLQFERLYDHVKALSDHREALPEAFAAWRSSLERGELDEAATWTLVAAADDPQVQAKVEVVLRRFAERALRGAPGIPWHDMAPQVRPPSWRNLPEAGGPPITNALCNTCTTPSVLPPPLPTCAYVTGDITAACPSDFWAIDLPAGETILLTMCARSCAAATGNFDARLRLRGPACDVVFENDDSCGTLPSVVYTPAAAGRFVVEVTGYGTTDVGSYTLAYQLVPLEDCGTCATPLQVLSPGPACQHLSDSNVACPLPSSVISTAGGAWYALNMTAGVCYSISTCPSFGGGVPCFGTATFDTRLDLWNSSCTTRVAGNDDVACSTSQLSGLIFTAPASGVYKLQVRGYASHVGDFTLGYGSCSTACTEPPVVAGAGPAGGSSGSGCARNQAFQVTLSSAAAAPAVGTFTITPGPGAAALPASGSFGFSSATGTFTSRLTKPPCGDATFDVSVDVTSDCGTTTTSWTYELRDTLAPVFVGCPSAQALDCAAPDPPPASPPVVDGCDPAPTVGFSETQVNGPCPGRFTTRRTWTAEDCEGNTSTCVQNLVHRDTTPPSLSGSDDFCLWPLDHQLHCLQASSLPLTWAEDCSEPVAVRFVGCVSSEPDSGTGDDDRAGDCLLSPDGQTACLRAERAADGTARTYSVLAVATDACGNASAPAAVATVTVPGDDAPHPECRASNSGFEPPF